MGQSFPNDNLSGVRNARRNLLYVCLAGVVIGIVILSLLPESTYNSLGFGMVTAVTCAGGFGLLFCIGIWINTWLWTRRSENQNGQSYTYVQDPAMSDADLGDFFYGLGNKVDQAGTDYINSFHPFQEFEQSEESYNGDPNVIDARWQNENNDLPETPRYYLGDSDDEDDY